MMYQLVLQWPASSIKDYDAMIEFEDSLIDLLSADDGEVDGHDMGSGQANIFIRTSGPSRVFNEVRALLSDRGLLTDCRAAFREVGGDKYEVLWPRGLKEFVVA